jgi:hypothetical protein
MEGVHSHSKGCGKMGRMPREVGVDRKVAWFGGTVAQHREGVDFVHMVC